jgi:hypothetical protein
MLKIKSKTLLGTAAFFIAIATAPSSAIAASSQYVSIGTG